MAPRTSDNMQSSTSSHTDTKVDSDQSMATDDAQPPATPSPRMRNQIFNQFCLPLSTGSDPIFDYSKLNTVWQTLSSK